MNKKFYRHLITDEELNTAIHWAQSSPIYKRSHRGEKGNLIGALGERVLSSWLDRARIEHLRTNEVGSDFSVKSNDGRFVTVEVKTKDRTVAPQPHYDVSVPEYVYAQQSPNFYVFVSLQRRKEQDIKDVRDAFLVGFIDRNTFDEYKRLETRGPKPNGANFFTNAWNMRISEIFPISEFPSRLGYRN